MIEIARAVSGNAKIIVMDEPTSSLSENEVEKLFTIIHQLRKQGITIIYISHKLDEIFNICDEATVILSLIHILLARLKKERKDMCQLEEDNKVLLDPDLEIGQSVRCIL